MTINAQTLNRLVNAIQDEVGIVSSTLREKGTQRFQKAILYSLLPAVIAYFGLYLPPVKKMQRLELRIGEAKKMSEYAKTYASLNAQLQSAYALMPPPTEKEGWLMKAALDTLRSEGIVSDSINPPVNDGESEIVMQTLSWSARVKFQQIVAWLNRTESYKPPLHISQVTITKSPDIGAQRVSCSICTLVPRKELKP